MYKKIMVAVDGSASSKQALAEAVKVALASDAHVSVVYVVDKSVLFTYAGRFDPHALVEEMRDDGRRCCAKPSRSSRGPVRRARQNSSRPKASARTSRSACSAT